MDALDLALLNDNVSRLIAGETVGTPMFDFLSRKGRGNHLFHNVDKGPRGTGKRAVAGIGDYDPAGLRLTF